MGPSFPCILAFSGSASGVPPQVAKNGLFAQRPYNGFISAVTGSILQFLAFWAFISLHFGLVGLHFLAFWPCGPSFPCILALVGLHFLAFWPCGPSFPCILALWAVISLHFGPCGLHFLAFWPLWAFISLHFGLVGLHFLAFWPCGPSFPCILALVGLHFLAFWPCGPSFPCILALWAFISLHFGLFGVSFWGSPPTSCQKWPVCPTSLQWIYQRRDRLHFAVFSLLGLHFLAFWPCGPSSLCILALWAFISLHFGLVGLHFLAFWLFGGQLAGSFSQVAKTAPFSQKNRQAAVYQRRCRIICLLFGLVGFHVFIFAFSKEELLMRHKKKCY